jgi:hypothetical protein
VAEREAQAQGAADDDVRARLVFERDARAAVVPRDGGQQRRVAAGDVRVLKVDAVAVDVGDRRQLQANRTGVADDPGVVREPEEIAGAVRRDRRHGPAGQRVDDDRRALLDALAVDAGRRFGQLLAVAQVAERPDLGLTGARDASTR